MTATTDPTADDQLLSLYITADRIRWASAAAAERPGDIREAGRLLEVQSRFALMLADPAYLTPLAAGLRELWTLRLRVAVLRGAIAGDPKDIAAGMPDGLTPIGTLEAAVRYALEAFEVTRAIDADPAGTEDMLTDAMNFLEAMRGALEATKD